ncbi:hypothetical protein EI94DRAFT_1738527 [Lactarius quietus]|nr:hypothetical protein EI94DRAFT_1738527 [Lactarius quietus]
MLARMGLNLIVFSQISAEQPQSPQAGEAYSGSVQALSIQTSSVKCFSAFLPLPAGTNGPEAETFRRAAGRASAF